MFFENFKMPKAFLFVYLVFFFPSTPPAKSYTHTPKENNDRSRKRKQHLRKVVLHNRGRHKMRGYIQVLHPDRAGREIRRLVQVFLYFPASFFLSAPESVWGLSGDAILAGASGALKIISKQLKKGS